jgi:hypothetical protein
MDKHEFHPIQDASYSDEPPTITGYREYAARMAKDQAQKREPETGPAEPFEAHLYNQKPFLAHYKALYRSEQKLRDHAPGPNYLTQMKAFIADVRDNQLPRLNEAADRKAVVRHIKGEYAQWGHERKELDARQRSHFSRNVEIALEKRLEHPENRLNRESCEFFARQEVVRRYCLQHEELNTTLTQDITKVIDRAFQRQMAHNRQNMDKSDLAILNEIAGQGREAVQARDRDNGPERGL